MSRRKRTLVLSEVERATLEQARDHHPLAYVRERAAALLRINAGQAAYHVAVTGLLKPRDPDTLYHWLNLYEQQGLAGLRLPRRTGRHFSPSAESRSQ
jgi:hypothetical protein